VRVSAAAGIHTILEADRRILASQRTSAGLTLALMGAALAALWRSVRLAVLALVVTLLPVALALAGAALAGITLNSVTVMVAAICLGIAIDNAVHFLTHWRRECRQGRAATALRTTVAAKARPICAANLVLVSVFLVLGLASFPPVVHFGLMASAAFLATIPAVLLWLPSLLPPPAGRDDRAGTGPAPDHRARC
jgi:hypothetical protein